MSDHPLPPPPDVLLSLGLGSDDRAARRQALPAAVIEGRQAAGKSPGKPATGVLRHMKLERHRGLRRTSIVAANDNDAVGRAWVPRLDRDGSYRILIAVLVGVALVYWLAVRFVDWDRIQTCVTMGKRNCVPPLELNIP